MENEPPKARFSIFKFQSFKLSSLLRVYIYINKYNPQTIKNSSL